MASTIFSSDIFVKGILPFLLVFALVFAVLDRSKILGEGKKQINAIIAFVVGILVVAFSYSTDVISKITVFAAVALVVLFVFMLLYGFVASDPKEGLKLNKGLQIAIGIVIVIGIVVAVLWATGATDYLTRWFTGDSKNTIWANVLLIAVIIGVIAAALATKSKPE